MQVEDAMVSEVISCSPGTSLQDIAIMMWENDCGIIPVVDEEERPVGVVTDRDIAMGAALKHQPLWDISAEAVMANREVISCASSDDIQNAIGLMERHEIRRVPVVNQYNQLCGILTMGDILCLTDSGKARSKKTDAGRIDASDIMGFLKHVSAHHKPHKAVLAG